MKTTTNLLDSAEIGRIDSEFTLHYQKEYTIPKSIHYHIRRYHLPNKKWVENLGMFIYEKDNAANKNYIQIRFCIPFHQYCEHKKCHICFPFNHLEIPIAFDCVDLYAIHFSSSFLSQFSSQVKIEKSKNDQILSFQYPHHFSIYFPLTLDIRKTLGQLLTHGYVGAEENIFVNAKIHDILLQSLSHISSPLFDINTTYFECKFLVDSRSKKNIFRARDILLQNIGNPISIKKLSKMVAMNECYLKKGFKEVFNTTIFDFYQQQRMEHAKYLLYEKEWSVTEVSEYLGYSSISHFSAAFKKHTGLKPCELLSQIGKQTID